MITEDFVSFEIAKLLKEKGFDIYVSSFYDVDGEFSRKKADWNWNIGSRYSAPTLQMAMKWLRKVHEIFIRPNISFLYPIRYYCEIFCYGDNLKTQQDVTTENFESPEEACEAAIKYCLEKLV
jgi:hypothetical protein